MALAIASPQPALDTTVESYTKQLVALHDSTNSFFVFVNEWRLSLAPPDQKAKSLLNIEIGFHVGHFVNAYDKGLEAAHTGHILAVDGIGLAERITNLSVGPDENPHIAEYLVQMKEWATKGSDEATETVKIFQEVQQGIKAVRIILFPDYVLSNSPPFYPVDLEKNIDRILRDLEKCVKMYIRWWTETGMLQKYQGQKVGEITLANAKDTIPVTLSTWTDLKDGYVQYVEQMKRVKDNNKEAFTFAQLFVPAGLQDSGGETSDESPADLSLQYPSDIPAEGRQDVRSDKKKRSSDEQSSNKEGERTKKKSAKKGAESDKEKAKSDKEKAKSDKEKAKSDKEKAKSDKEKAKSEGVCKCCLIM
ncbi:hypothetical protein CVT25_000515 [Psilocybe cyanescens]|uniref:Uncharacterized protein n=1 Tax=Psilocybe cyanescens TaxID=93625 RepID=A0A409XRU4_PSICY|nr:hypothetical protein CVT25_000515 [Psilocybe cyanescens]